MKCAKLGQAVFCFAFCSHLQRTSVLRLLDKISIFHSVSHCGLLSSIYGSLATESISALVSLHGKLLANLSEE